MFKAEELEDYEVLDRLEELGSQSLSRQRGFVYVISTVQRNPCKIGWAIDPEKRRAQHQASNPDELVVHFASESRWPRRVENHAKKLLKPHRLRPKHEWYDVDVETAIAAIRGAEEICAEPSKRGETASRFDRLNLTLLLETDDGAAAPRRSLPKKNRFEFLF